MPGNKYNSNSSIPTSRLERLLRERELRKSSRASHSNEGTDNNLGVSHVEQYLEGALAAQTLGEGWERPDRIPLRQRLLVVANRLPVSAVRRGEESWSLEISAGGLVSALLGKCELELCLLRFIVILAYLCINYVLGFPNSRVGCIWVATDGFYIHRDT